MEVVISNSKVVDLPMTLPKNWKESIIGETVVYINYLDKLITCNPPFSLYNLQHFLDYNNIEVTKQGYFDVLKNISQIHIDPSIKYQYENTNKRNEFKKSSPVHIINDEGDKLKEIKTINTSFNYSNNNSENKIQVEVFDKIKNITHTHNNDINNNNCKTQIILDNLNKLTLNANDNKEKMPNFLQYKRKRHTLNNSNYIDYLEKGNLNKVTKINEFTEKEEQSFL